MNPDDQKALVIIIFATLLHVDNGLSFYSGDPLWEELAVGVLAQDSPHLSA